jgi:H+/Cl- antiporter ClcA
MEKYLEENIKYKTHLLTLFFYLVVAIVTGLIGLLLSENFGTSKLQLLLFFMGFLAAIIFLIYLLYLNEDIKTNIKKLKQNEY